MSDNQICQPEDPRRIPWNKGKLIGARPRLRQKHVWAIRTWLQIEQRTRDLALFNLAIDSKLRGRDLDTASSRTTSTTANQFSNSLSGSIA